MKRVIALALGIGWSITAMSAAPTPADSEANLAQLRTNLAKKVPGAKAEDVHVSPIPGLYEVALGSSIAYISADGRYLISGDLYEVQSRTNLTEARRVDSRVKALASVSEDDMIVFTPTVPVKHTITVFTDVDCAYCRKLHSEITELNKLGIRVRYMAFPRTGPGTESWAKAEAVWCAKDRKDAITRAKQGMDIKAAKCGATPVAREYAMGEDLGVSGTPAVITDKGDYLGGYLPPQKMLAYLETGKTE
jgi:thiol:disulfide interchange protein DsbC